MGQSRLRAGALDRDSGVSAIIAVILMVAITTITAAAVFVWLSSMGDTQEELATSGLRASAIDVDGNGADEWIRVHLVKVDQSFVGARSVSFTILAPDGSSHYVTIDTPADLVCLEPDDGAILDDGACDDAGDGFFDDPNNRWRRGGLLYVPCQAPVDGNGVHHLTVEVLGRTVLQESVICDEVA